MSLGILRVAACLEGRGVPVEVLDLSGVSNYEEAVKFHCSHTEANIFGITATTPQMPSAHVILCAIKRHCPEFRVVLGGPHPTLVLAAVKKEKNFGRATQAKADLEESFDVLVAGDGEEAIFRAISEDPPKWIDADDPESSLFMTSEKLNAMPFPARHLVDAASYRYSIDGVPAMSLIAQLGCPFGCGFCGGRSSPMLRRVRTRTTANVLAELEHLYRTCGMKGFMLYDDELNVNKKLVELMEGISGLQRKLGVEFRLRGFVKAELFNDYQAAAMYQAGFRWILTGFESGSPRILENIQKRASVQQNTECVATARRHGLKVKALMSLGHPGESSETIQETKKWLLDVRPDDFDVTIITPYPGSPYYDESAPIPGGDWLYIQPQTFDKLYSKEVDYFETADYYKGDPEGGYRCYVYTDFLGPSDLVRGRDRLEAETRAALKIPYNPSAPALRFEHSMGQTSLPDAILRSTQIKGGILAC